MSRRRRQRLPAASIAPGYEYTCGEREPSWLERGIIKDVAHGYAKRLRKLRRRAEREGAVFVESPVNNTEIEQPAEFFNYADKHSGL